MELFADGRTIVLSDRSPFDPTSEDAPYDFTYELDAELRVEASSRHAIEVREPDGTSLRCLVTSGGGASGVHPYSALVRGHTLIVAVGPRMCALRLQGLGLEWNVVVDGATCFGVYYSAKHDCYISHGELEITRVALDGSIVWAAGGKDIFSEGFSLEDDYAEVVDFNHERYRIDIATGRCSIVK